MGDSTLCCVCAQEIRQQHEAVAEGHFTSYKAEQVVKRCSCCGHGLEKINGCDIMSSAPLTESSL